MNILISGAGIAGTTLAYWLQRAGHTPTLVERAPQLRQGGYLIDFWGTGYDVAERMGIIDALHESGYHIKELREVSRRGRPIARLDPRTLLGPIGERFISISRADLASAIFNVLRFTLRDGATMFFFTFRHDGPIPDDTEAQQQLLLEQLREVGWEVPEILTRLPEARTFYLDKASQIRMPTWPAMITPRPSKPMSASSHRWYEINRRQHWQRRVFSHLETDDSYCAATRCSS